jgi:hypothetical protein
MMIGRRPYAAFVGGTKLGYDKEGNAFIATTMQKRQNAEKKRKRRRSDHNIGASFLHFVRILVSAICLEC